MANNYCQKLSNIDHNRILLLQMLIKTSKLAMTGYDDCQLIGHLPNMTIFVIMNLRFE